MQEDSSQVYGMVAENINVILILIESSKQYDYLELKDYF